MMTNYSLVLKELMIAGYEGQSLLVAFERMCAAICGTSGQKMHESLHEGVATAKSAIKSAMSRPRAVAYPVPDKAKVIGRKALLASGLPASVTAVGSQLLEHFNLDTGRCDPGSTGIAIKLGVSLRTVQRAIERLVAAGLFTVAQNAGRAHANAYFPVWPRLVELAETTTASPPLLSLTPDKSGGQNLRTKPEIPSVVVKAQRARRQHVQDRKQRELALMRPLDGGKVSRPIAESAREATRARLFAELREVVSEVFPGDKAAFVAVISKAGAVDYGPIIAAEMVRRGSGLALLLDAVGMSGRRKVSAG
jgi:hypothetical protein